MIGMDTVELNPEIAGKQAGADLSRKVRCPSPRRVPQPSPCQSVLPELPARAPRSSLQRRLRGQRVGVRSELVNLAALGRPATAVELEEVLELAHCYDTGRVDAIVAQYKRSGVTATTALPRCVLRQPPRPTPPPPPPPTALWAD